MAGRLGRHFRARGEWYWAIALYTACVAILYYPILSGDAGFGWDTIESYWPDLAYFTEQLRDGEWPLWNPYDRGGYPFYADPQAATMYPVQWLLAGLGLIVGDSPWWLAQAKMLLHHVLAALLLHAFLRGRGLERMAAVTASVAWIACTPWLIHKASNVLLPMAWTPLIWLVTDRFISKPSSRYALLLAGSIYLPGSAGSPPGFFYTLLLAAPYFVYRFLATYSDRRRRKEPAADFVKQVLKLGSLAGLVTGCLLIIIIVPGLELAELTERAQRGQAYSLSFPLPVRATIIGLLVPAAGKMDAYLGLIPLLLIAAALTNPRRDRGMSLYFTATGIFFLALAFGGATPILGWLVDHLPGFGLFRASNRYKLVFAVSMAPVVGYGASVLIRSAPRFSAANVRIAGAAFFALALVIVIALKLDASPGQTRSPSDSLIIAAISIVIVLGAAWHPRRAAAPILSISVLLLLADSDYFWHQRGKILEAQPDHKADLTKLESLPGAGKDTRIYDEFQLEQRAGSRLGIRDFRGYPSGDPLDLSHYREVLAKLDEYPELLAAYNVGYVLHGRHHRNGTRKNRLSRRPSSIQTRDFIAAGSVDIVRAPTPQLAWYNTILPISGNATLDAVAVQARRQPGARVAVINPQEIEDAPEHRAFLVKDKTILSGAGKITTFEADRVVGAVQVPGTALVVLNEVAYPGWTVSVDGREAKSLTANYLLRGVIVEAGTHVIEWRFAPRHYPWLLLSWLLAALAVILAAFAPNPTYLRRFWPRAGTS